MHKKGQNHPFHLLLLSLLLDRDEKGLKSRQ